MSAALALIILVVIAFQIYKFITCVPPNAPPCIPRLPIIGSYWHLLWYDYNFPYKAIPYYMEKLKSKILTVYLGSYMVVTANDYKSIKEVFTKEDFDGRNTNVDVLLTRSYGKSLGIFFTEGPSWQEQRRFALRHLRDFGFGRRHVTNEADMMEELALLIQMLKEGPINEEEQIFLRNGQALFPDVLFPYSANSIWNIMFGQRFDRSEHYKPRYLCEAAVQFQRSNDVTGGAIFFFWFLKYFGNMFGYKGAITANARLLKFVTESLEKRKHTGTDYDRGMVDRYLKELQKRGNEKESSFSEEQLIMTIVDFIFPSLSAMPSVIVHAIKLVMHHPRVAKNIQAEIDRVVGRGRLITWEDRKSLPYTEATIREAMRYETLTPFGVFHKALVDTSLCGFDIPKNTFVVTNLHALNGDRDLWGDPERFRPERFLTEDGQLDKDLTFSFGFGHRVCAGETFARYNMFGLFAMLMQNFQFSFIDNEPTGMEDKLPGLITIPKRTWIAITPRK